MSAGRLGPKWSGNSTVGPEERTKKLLVGACLRQRHYRVVECTSVQINGRGRPPHGALTLRTQRRRLVKGRRVDEGELPHAGIVRDLQLRKVPRHSLCVKLLRAGATSSKPRAKRAARDEPSFLRR